MKKQSRIQPLLDSMQDVFTFTIDGNTADDLLHLILTKAIHMTEAQAGSILMYDKSLDELYFKYSIGGSGSSLTQVRLPRGKGLGWQCIHKNRVLNYDDVANTPHYFKDIEKLTKYKTKTMILAPLKYKAEIFGVIELINKGNQSRPFTQVDCRILELFSQYASIALKMIEYKEEMILKERWAAIGHATSGVAHYIKNILNSMEVSSSLLETSLNKNDLANSHYSWNILKRNIKKMSRFTLNLLRYSTQKEPTLQRRSINNFLKMFIRDFKNSYQDSRSIHFFLKFSPDIPKIYFDLAVMTDVFYNLFLNSLEAFSNRTEELKIRIETSCDKVKKTVFIEYEDNGPGIDQEARKYIFEPFKNGKVVKSFGYGLGLSTVKLNIKQHGGQFWIDDSRKKYESGVLFMIMLPLHPPHSNKKNNTNKSKKEKKNAES